MAISSAMDSTSAGRSPALPIILIRAGSSRHFAAAAAVARPRAADRAISSLKSRAPMAAESPMSLRIETMNCFRLSSLPRRS